MDVSSVLELIKDGVDTKLSRQVWLDLGAGSGTFTTVLAGLLDPQSSVYAVDRNNNALKQIRQASRGATTILVEGDFVKDDFDAPLADGILMANSFHFVKDKISFLRTLKRRMIPDGRIVIVEYDRKSSNRWVPYPLPFEELKSMASDLGFLSVTRLGEVPSVFGNVKMYGACLL